MKVFVSSLLLRHLQAVSTNGLEIAECILKNNDITKFDIIPVGGAIFPTMSFFNHSCYPNALRIGYQNHQVEMIMIIMLMIVIVIMIMIITRWFESSVGFLPERRSTSTTASTFTRRLSSTGRREPLPTTISGNNQSMNRLREGFI